MSDEASVWTKNLERALHQLVKAHEGLLASGDCGTTNTSTPELNYARDVLAGRTDPCVCEHFGPLECSTCGPSERARKLVKAVMSTDRYDLEDPQQPVTELLFHIRRMEDLR